MLETKKIAIIGGGPGGLMLAILLQKKGMQVIVYERDLNKDARVQGGTLDLHKESGLLALIKAGLLEDFKSNYRIGADKMRIVDNNANLFYDQHLEETTENFEDEHFRPEIDRGTLRNIMLQALKPNTIVWNSTIIALDKLENSWELTFENGHSVTADMVIGADGANSKIRQYLTSIEPIYSGVTIVEGSIYNAKKNTPKINELLKGGKIFAFGNEQSIIVSSKGDGSISFYTGCKVNELWYKESGIDFKSQTSILQWFKKEFQIWNALWLELFENDKVTVIARPQYYMPLNQKWDAQSNLTIIGDAAHLMPPYAGEGVNMAMLDALELSEALTNTDFNEPKNAIHHYENNMLKRASAITQITLEQTDSLHSLDAIKNMMKMFA